MSMEKAIQNFPQQLAWKPVLENTQGLNNFKKFVVLGMGGSNLTAGLLKMVDPTLEVVVHKDYGLPALPRKELQSRLIIAVSYSGNTEETLDGFQQAIKNKLAVVAVATGGKLLELAKQQGVPYVQLPDTGIQPRMATGFQFKALATLLGLTTDGLRAMVLSRTLKPEVFSAAGQKLAALLKGHVPVIYASTHNAAIAYSWKIKFNETGKIPAFYNVLPELNHNEMTGFDTVRQLAKPFHFIFLHDPGEHPRIQQRMRVLGRLYQKRGLPVETVPLAGKDMLHKIFTSLLLADWAAYYMAQQYHLEPEQVPLVEEFKRLI